MTGDDREIVATCIYDSGISASLAVVDALATVEDDNITNIGYRLYDHVHPGALNTLTEHENTSGKIEITFPVNEYLVEINSKNNVLIFE